MHKYSISYHWYFLLLLNFLAPLPIDQRRRGHASPVCSNVLLQFSFVILFLHWTVASWSDPSSASKKSDSTVPSTPCRRWILAVTCCSPALRVQSHSLLPIFSFLCADVSPQEWFLLLQLQFALAHRLPSRSKFW